MLVNVWTCWINMISQQEPSLKNIFFVDFSTDLREYNIFFTSMALTRDRQLVGELHIGQVNLHRSDPWSFDWWKIQVYVNDSIPVANLTFRWAVDWAREGLPVDLALGNIQVPWRYQTGTLDIYVGLPSHQELLGVHRQGKLAYFLTRLLQGRV